MQDDLVRDIVILLFVRNAHESNPDEIRYMRHGHLYSVHLRIDVVSRLADNVARACWVSSLSYYL